MQIYLVQHGEAKPETEDPERPLTDKGRRDVEASARYAAALGAEVTQILHSGKLRAKQTAEVLMQFLLPSHGIREEKGLAPLDDPHLAERLVGQSEKPLMIVGHLPHLSRLASLLILGIPEKEVIKFTMGGVVCLTKSDDRWLVKWALGPEIIKDHPLAEGLRSKNG